MERRQAIITAIMANLLFIILEIDKRTQTQKLSAHKEHLTHDLRTLERKHQELSAELAYLQSPETIKHYALNHLHMQQANSSQRKTV